MAPETPPRVERREFVKLLALVGMSSAVGAAPLALAQAAPAKSDSTAAKPAAPAEETPEISDDARALAGIVEGRYGKHLKPDQLKEVTDEIQFRLRIGKTLRELKLTNGDEPDFVFSAE